LQRDSLAAAHDPTHRYQPPFHRRVLDIIDELFVMIGFIVARLAERLCQSFTVRNLPFDRPVTLSSFNAERPHDGLEYTAFGDRDIIGIDYFGLP
jgi:hypothetical protein